MAQPSNNGLKIALFTLFIIVIGGGGLFFFRDFLDQSKVAATGDANQIEARFNLDMDGWIGYMPICSDELQNRLRRKAIELTCNPDGADYANRMSRLKQSKTDLVMMTVGAQLLNGYGFPGTTISVIDQSKGGDALTCWEDQISGIDELGTKTDWKIAFTPGSPSHQLLRSLANDFGPDRLLKNNDWKVETNGAEDAFKRFQNKSVQCAVLWEPYVTSALQLNGTKIIYSSAQADKVIVDILVARRDLLLEGNVSRKYLLILLEEYYTLLREMREQLADTSQEPTLVINQARAYLRQYADTRATDDQIKAMIAGLEWISLRDNAENWYGVGGTNPYFGLKEANDFAIDIIREETSGFLRGFKSGQVISSRLIRTLYLKGGSQTETVSTITDPLKQSFTFLPDNRWPGLDTVGTLRSRPINFGRDSAELGNGAAQALTEAMEDLKRYPTFRVELLIGYQGNSDKAPLLSQQRAEVVVKRMVDAFGVDQNRLNVRVVKPSELDDVIPRRAGEKTRAYNSRFRTIQLQLKTTPN